MNDTDIKNELGSFIKQKRKERKLTLAEVQSLTEIDYRYLSNIENGRGNLSEERLKKLSIALGIDIDILLAKAEKVDSIITDKMIQNPMLIKDIRKLLGIC